MDAITYLEFDRHVVPIKRLNKIYSEKGQIQKGEVVDYYIRIAPYILPHLQNKPFSMIHFPEGVNGKSFYQKQCPSDAPAWLKTVNLESSSERGSIDWCLVNDTASLVYMANRGVLEMHPWFSRLPDLSVPDVAVIDLDPSGATGFDEAVKIAQIFHPILEQLNIYSVPKTSGSRGVHICIPTKSANFDRVQAFLKFICGAVANAYPDLATLERRIPKRGNRIYLDAVQNAQGKTIAAPYSLRARDNLPVSAPLEWDELYDPKLHPQNFTLRNIFTRLDQKGDLFKNFYKNAKKLPEFK